MIVESANDHECQLEESEVRSYYTCISTLHLSLSDRARSKSNRARTKTTDTEQVAYPPFTPEGLASDTIQNPREMFSEEGQILEAGVPCYYLSG